MHTHNGANITSQVSAAGSDSEIFDRVQTVGVDHEIAVVFIHSRGFASVAVVEELGHGLALNLVDGIHVEPGRVARENDGVSLRDEVVASRGLDGLLGLDLLSFGFGNTCTSLAPFFGFCWRVAHLFVGLGGGDGGRGCRRIKRVLGRGGRVGRGAILFDGSFLCAGFQHLHIG